MYLVRTPKIVQKLYGSRFLWHIPTKDKRLFLTFDDGPTPELTPLILQTLEKYKAKASFFCVGENAMRQTDLMKEIKAAGHSIGQHTHQHLNGWQTPTKNYLADVDIANAYITSNLFRPPYGRIKRTQAKQLIAQGYTIVMWSVLSGDFDLKLSPEHCLQNLNHSRPGDIIVMHDNVKSEDKLRYCLPRFLDNYSKQGYNFCAL